MKDILKNIRHSQWRWDYVAASHGGSFHAPLESARLLGSSIQKSEEARVMLSGLLTKLNVKLPLQMPDISTKEKAQQLINLDMKKLYEHKNEFIKTTLPVWDKESGERQSKMNK
jgi:nitrite reductase (cytochrome c-552)